MMQMLLPPLLSLSLSFSSPFSPPLIVHPRKIEREGNILSTLASFEIVKKTLKSLFVVTRNERKVILHFKIEIKRCG